jgi:predicted N-acetyltransferase YhbS
MRVMTEDDLDATDEVVRLAFGTFHSLADPAKAFGDADRVRTRFRAARLRLVAELDGEVVGAVFVTHLGPLLSRADAVWVHGIAAASLSSPGTR